MKPGVYFARVGKAGFPIKIGYSIRPLSRLDGLCNYYKREITLLAHIPSDTWALEDEIHAKFAPWALGYELFHPSPEIMAMIEAHKIEPLSRQYEERAPHHSRRKTPAVIMTPKRIALVGDYLNGRNGKPKLSGPKVAKKLGVSTASIYAHWKRSGHGRFVRKKPKD